MIKYCNFILILNAFSKVTGKEEHSLLEAGQHFVLLFVSLERENCYKYLICFHMGVMFGCEFLQVDRMVLL